MYHRHHPTPKLKSYTKAQIPNLTYISVPSREKKSVSRWLDFSNKCIRKAHMNVKKPTVLGVLIDENYISSWEEVARWSGPMITSKFRFFEDLNSQFLKTWKIWKHWNEFSQLHPNIKTSNPNSTILFHFLFCFYLENRLGK